MAIHIKPQKEKSFRLPSSFDVLFYYSIILFLFCLSGYLLISQWNSELHSQIQDREDLLTRLEGEADFNKNQDLVYEYRNKIVNYTYLVWNKTRIKDFFLFLENATHPFSRLESVRIDLEKGTISITGETLNFRTLEQQHSILKNFSMERELIGWINEDQIINMEVDWKHLKNLEYLFEVSDSGEYDYFDWVFFDMNGQLIKRDLGDKDDINAAIQIKFPNDYRGTKIGVKATKHRDAENLSKELILSLPKVSSDDIVLVEEKYSDDNVIVKKAVTLHKSPVNKQDAITVNFEKQKKVSLLNYVKKEDYVFQKGMRGYNLLDQDWYEVAVVQEISPIKTIKLVEVKERAGENLGVAFQFDIEFDPLMFKSI